MNWKHWSCPLKACHTIGDQPLSTPRTNKKVAFFSCWWNCWNKFCIAALIFNNNTVFCWDSWNQNLKGCVHALLSHYEEKKVCTKEFKPLHIQEQIPIIDLGCVSLSLLLSRSCWSVFIFPPQQNKQKHTFAFSVNRLWLEMQFLEWVRKSCWNHISQVWLEANWQKVQPDHTQTHNTQINSSVELRCQPAEGSGFLSTWSLHVLTVCVGFLQVLQFPDRKKANKHYINSRL